jgi:phosphoribosylformylglycinamidine cyclo-ligase
MRYPVDIDRGNEFAKSIPGVGGFSGIYPLPDGQLLVSGADGVGTKINIAKIAGDFTTIGIDLVAMCVNDVITSGAKPLYFMDYISCGKITPILDEIMEGIYKGCEISGMKLLGGETAEHPRIAPPKAYGDDLDLAGFCTGLIEHEGNLIDGTGIKPGDTIVGVASSGLHSNGFSLINDMLWRHELVYKEHPEILTPTHIYAPMVRKIMTEKGEHPVFGMAHITGGGLEENINRIMPTGLHAYIDWSSWRRPEIFNVITWASRQNDLTEDVSEEELRRVFNCGIGFALVTPFPQAVMDIIDEETMIIGKVVDNS